VLLALEGVSRSFGGVRAADGVSFAVQAGAVHGLIGPNGAGKTTVINLISGLLRPTAGRITLDGRRIDRLPAHRIASLGVRRTFQNIRLFPAMSVLDNVTVGQHGLRSVSLLERLWFSPRDIAEQRALAAEARELLALVGVSGRDDERAASLPYGDQRRLEIARALASRPRLLLLDEPAAGLNQTEARARLARARPGGGWADGAAGRAQRAAGDGRL
jgi:ABC-type branched-subunit amino acid transport system ATPase component